MNNNKNVVLPPIYTSVEVTAYMTWGNGGSCDLTFSSLESAVHEARRMIGDGFGYFVFCLVYGTFGVVATAEFSDSKLTETDSVGIYLAIVEGIMTPHDCIPSVSIH